MTVFVKDHNIIRVYLRNKYSLNELIIKRNPDRVIVYYLIGCINYSKIIWWTQNFNFLTFGTEENNNKTEIFCDFTEIQISSCL